jgi:4-hydroxy-3-polyprenylbenzoate decarboxylase
MAYRALADFLEALADRQLLVRVGAEVDPQLELAEIARRSAQTGGPALLFDRVRGCSLPIVANLLATAERACLALSLNRLDELSERTAEVMRQSGPQGWLERLTRTPEQSPGERLRARPVRTAGCQQIVRLGRDIDLGTLAVLQAWPDETGRWLTGAQLVVGDASGSQQLAPCRLQLVDRTRLAVVDDGTGESTRLIQAAQSRGERLSAAVVLGGDPAHAIAAAVPNREALDASALVGLLRGAALETVKCRTHALEVPADADLVLEGTFDPAIAPVVVTVGSLGQPYYRPPLEAPIVEIEALTQRSSPLLNALIGSEAELAVMRKAIERILLPLVRGAIPELVEFALPSWGGGDRFALLAIRKTVPLGARRAASALWGLAALESVKFVVIVDEDVDVHDSGQVWARLGANVDPGRDTFVREGPAAPADHSFSVPLVGRQMGIDATRKLPGEVPAVWPGQLTAGREVCDLVERRWKEYGL